MPFAARRRHQFWSADIRYADNDEVGGRAYVVSVLDNHSRAILASAVTRTQDLASYLSVLYAAVERYGSPEALVIDGGGICTGGGTGSRDGRPLARGKGLGEGRIPTVERGFARHPRSHYGSRTLWLGLQGSSSDKS